MSSVDLNRYLAVLTRWWWLLVSAAALAALVSFLTLRPVPPTYISSTTMMVGESFRNPKPAGTDFSTSQQLADTYSEMVLRQPILEATLKAINLPVTWQTLRDQIRIVHQPGSITFEIRVQDIDPRRARDVANGVAQQLIAASPTASNQQEQAERKKFVKQELDALQARIQQGRIDLEAKQAALAKETSARGVIDRQDELKALGLNLDSWRTSYASLLASYEDPGSPNSLSIIEPASLPTVPSGQNMWFSVALAAVAGLLLASAAVLLIEYLDDTVKGKEELEGLLGAPVLGLVSRLARLRDGSRELLVLSAPESPEAEAFRVFAANLRFASLGDGNTVVLVSSPGQGDGKSSIAANLAAALALGGKDVLLADIDLRSPSLHTFFDASNETGVTSLLLEPNKPATDFVLETSLPHLKLITSGPIPPNPSELLSAHGGALVKQLQALVDYVILDSPPVLPVADALILAEVADGTILVAQASRTRRPLIRAALEALGQAKSRLYGGFLNAVPEGSAGLYGYHYPRERKSPLERLMSGRRKSPATVAFPPPKARVGT